MLKEVNFSDSKFSFEFKGDEGIYVNTLKETIENTVSILQEITKEREPQAFVKLKITKFDTGSFDINFLAIVEYTKTLMNHADEIANSLVGTFTSIFIIKHFLKGGKPKEIINRDSKTTIINHKDEELETDSKTADTYFKNPIIDRMIINIFNIMDEDSGKTRLIIKDQMKNEVAISRENFSNMRKRIVEEETKAEVNNIIKSTIKTELLIRKPDLTGRSQWGFILDKNIDATIEDKDFLEKVHNERMAFAPGDRLPVVLNLEVHQDDNGDIIKGTEKYIITRVTGKVIKENKSRQLTIEEL